MLLAAWSLLESVRFGFYYFGLLFGLHSYNLEVSNSDHIPYAYCCVLSPSEQLIKPQQSMNSNEDIDEVWEALDLIEPNVISKVVHKHNIVQNLDEGSYIIVTGRLKEDCLRFAVDFTVGERSLVDGTIAFHFNPRLREKHVVRNCFLKGYWGEEETASATPFDFANGSSFKLIFFITHEQFMVSVNNRHYCSFRHRVSYDQISSIHFVGAIHIDEVTLKFAEEYPIIKDNKMPIHNVLVNQFFSEENKNNLAVPFCGKLKEELELGMCLEICGKIKLLPHSFYVNLQGGLNIWPHPVIPLHLNPRFSASCGANAFVRNCWADNHWSNEERAPGFPFFPGYEFAMVIVVEEECYSVWVDKKLIGEYPYKVSGKVRIDSIYIQGDIFLHHVSVHTDQKSLRLRDF